MVVKCLEVTVGSTAGLKENRASTRNDPFAVVRLGDVEYRTDAGRGATSRVVWNHRFSFLLPEEDEVPKQELEVDIWDHQENGADKFIGSCKVNLMCVYRKGAADVVQAVHRQSGKLLGHIRFHLSLLIEDVNHETRDSLSPPSLTALPQAIRMPSPPPAAQPHPAQQARPSWPVKPEPSHWQNSQQLQQQLQQQQQQQQARVAKNVNPSQHQSSTVDLLKQIQLALHEAQLLQFQQQLQQQQQQLQMEQEQAAAYARHHQLPPLQRKSTPTMLPPLPPHRPTASPATFPSLADTKPLPPLARQTGPTPVQMKKMLKLPPLNLSAVSAPPPPPQPQPPPQPCRSPSPHPPSSPPPPPPPCSPLPSGPPLPNPPTWPGWAPSSPQPPPSSVLSAA